MTEAATFIFADIAGFTALASGAACVVTLSWSSPPRSPTEAAAIPVTPITQTEGTATVSSADRLAGWRRREERPPRETCRPAAADRPSPAPH